MRGVETAANSRHGITNTAIDRVTGQIYITDFQGAIERANLDGMRLETLVSGQFAAEGIARDIADGKMYWAAQGTIRRGGSIAASTEGYWAQIPSSTMVANQSAMIGPNVLPLRAVPWG